MADSVRIEPWRPADQPLLERLLGDPAMMVHLGGPEGVEQIAERHRGYAQPGSRQYRVEIAPTGEAVGWVGYWEREWRGETVFEIGWSVLPPFQGRGIATLATASAIELARSERTHRHLYAYPSVTNPASNAICRRAGFALLGQGEHEYLAGQGLLCNVWRLDLAVRPSR